MVVKSVRYEGIFLYPALIFLALADIVSFHEIKTFINRQKQCPSEGEEKEKISMEIEKKDEISKMEMEENEQKQKEQILIMQKQDHVEQELQDVGEELFFELDEQVEVEDIEKKLREIDEEKIL